MIHLSTSSQGYTLHVQKDWSSRSWGCRLYFCFPPGGGDLLLLLRMWCRRGPGLNLKQGCTYSQRIQFLRLVTPAPLLTHTVPPLLLRLFADFVGVIFQCWLYTVDRLKSIKLYHTSTPQIRATHNIDSLGFYKSTPPLILEFKKHLLNYLLFKKNKIRLFAFINWRISSEHFPFLSYILSTQCFFCYEADLLCYVIFHNC